MEKALQNPHYKKIWEKVMINRHPEVKSLEEALKSESKEALCLIETDTGINFIAILEEQCKPYYSYPFYNIHKIYGREITLEDILLLLKGYFAGIHVDINGIFKLNGIGQPADWSIIGWNFTKPLHEQNTDVWETISKLID